MRCITTSLSRALSLFLSFFCIVANARQLAIHIKDDPPRTLAQLLPEGFGPAELGIAPAMLSVQWPNAQVLLPYPKSLLHSHSLPRADHVRRAGEPRGLGERGPARTAALVGAVLEGALCRSAAHIQRPNASLCLSLSLLSLFLSLSMSLYTFGFSASMYVLKYMHVV